jgi:hypothetical protein
MEKDQSIRNQKVFIRLDKVLDLQKSYLNSIADVKKHYPSNGNNPSLAWQRAFAQKQTLEQVIKTLDLPIEISR